MAILTIQLLLLFFYNKIAMRQDKTERKCRFIWCRNKHLKNLHKMKLVALMLKKRII